MNLIRLAMMNLLAPLSKPIFPQLFQSSQSPWILTLRMNPNPQARHLLQPTLMQSLPINTPRCMKIANGLFVKLQRCLMLMSHLSLRLMLSPKALATALLRSAQLLYLLHLLQLP
jgi:hypothetical protein